MSQDNNGRMAELRERFADTSKKNELLAVIAGLERELDSDRAVIAGLDDDNVKKDAREGVDDGSRVHFERLWPLYQRTTGPASGSSVSPSRSR